MGSVQACCPGRTLLNPGGGRDPFRWQYDVLRLHARQQALRKPLYRNDIRYCAAGLGAQEQCRAGLHQEIRRPSARVENLAEKITAIRDRRERHKDMLAALDRTGESQISLTDPDSRAMAAHTHVAVGYNVQVAVDAKHKLIVEQQVTNQVGGYMGLLAQTRRDQPKKVLGVERIAVVADKGYFKIEDIEACEKAGIDHLRCHVTQREFPRSRAGLFRKDEFSYDPARESFPLPGGSAASSLFVFSDPWLEEDQLPQQPRPAATARNPFRAMPRAIEFPLRVSFRERGRDVDPHAGHALARHPRHPRPTPRDRPSTRSARSSSG